MTEKEYNLELLLLAGRSEREMSKPPHARDFASIALAHEKLQRRWDEAAHAELDGFEGDNGSRT